MDVSYFCTINYIALDIINCYNICNCFSSNIFDSITYVIYRV